jgi:hypothetical protein|tara:strand:+ start:295 stop:687 length:393 start_codon:yes stop_codon:yes gene_type:complete
MIFLLSMLFAEEPKYKNLKEGEVAPWDGRLLNEAAMRILVEESATKDMVCEAKTAFELNKLKIEEKYRYDVLKVQTDAEIKKLNELISLQDEHIKQLNPQNNIWPAIGGFIGGAAISIGIMYAVKPGLTQ